MVVYSNVKYDSGYAYILFIGPFKYSPLPSFLLKKLRKYYGKEVRIIYIFPNHPPKYSNGEFMVINKELENCSRKYHIKITTSQLNKQVSDSLKVKRLLKKILKNQKNLYIYPFKDTPDLTIHHGFEDVTLIGPKTDIFGRYGDKFFQHETADILGIPQPRWFLVPSKEDLIRIYKIRFNKKAFITKLYGASGSGCAVVNSKKDLINHPNIDKEDCKYIIEDYIDFKDSPTTEAMVANENEVLFLGVMDQILNKFSYSGTIYPSKLNSKIKRDLRKYTLRLGKYLGRHGFRGFFSIDFVVDRRNRIYFSEVNPRVGGSTLEKIYAHEVTKKKNSPSLPELELRAVTRNTFGNISQKDIISPKFSWGVRKIKTPLPKTEFTPEYSELKAFRNKRTITIPLTDLSKYSKKETETFKVVSVSDTRRSVEEELNNGGLKN